MTFAAAAQQDVPSRPCHYEVVGSGVLDYVDRFAPDEVYELFYEKLEALMTGPYPDDDYSLGIMELKDPTKPNGFTAPFNRGLVAYQVTKDFPLIKLVDVFWLDEEDPDSDVGWDYGS
jgi:hypothetical protein